MPFGAMFAALFFGAVAICATVGAVSGLEGLSRFSLGLLAITLALGLLRGRVWARWGGALTAALLTVWLLVAAPAAGPLPMVLLFGSTAAAALLALPFTGRPLRDASAPESSAASAQRAAVAAAAPPMGALGWSALAAAVALLLGVWWSASADAPWRAPASASSDVQQAERIAERVRWTDFGTGLERARSEGKPLLVAFVTNWCGYCRKMDRTTWKHPTVVERMGEVVAVRIDADEARERNGFIGRELAGKYGVSGYPTVMLLDAGGRMLARAGGYQEPHQLLGWLEDSFSGLGRRSNMQTSSP